MNSDIIIIGGGASGLISAIAAARQGASVMILEHKERIGKKILATGNGKCNFTNRKQIPGNYRGEDPEFAWNVLQKFGATDTIDFFEHIGIKPKERNGYLYPASDQASSVLDVLRMEIGRYPIVIRCEEHVEQIRKKRDRFIVQTNNEEYYADQIILCTGGKAAKTHGSDGSGYALAKQLGHKVTTVVPALTSCYIKGTFMKGWAGVRVNAKVSLFIDRMEGIPTAEEIGELQMVDYGISGIPIFQISRYAAFAVEGNKQVFIKVDFFPEYSYDELLRYMEDRMECSPFKTMEEQMIGMFHKKLNIVLLKESDILPWQESNRLPESKVKKLCQTMKAFFVEVTRVNSFDKAQATAGGVLTKEVNAETMESNIITGLYFAGEILDIDGTCGGYNLQWAWSTGYIAGTHAGKRKR